MYKSEMIKTLSSLIKLPSVFSEDTELGAPFGKNIARGLEEILRLGSDMGFTTKNLDGYVGEVQLNTGEKMIGILCHSDVVEPGDGWDTDPFEPTLIGDKLYGRGSADDKAGIVCALYAMKYLKEHHLLRNDFSVRLIIGTDEELGWNDMEYYKKHADRFPDVSLVIDANFPVIYCEKGLWDFDLKWKSPNRAENSKKPIQLLKLTGGSARNVLPAKATAVLSCDNINQVYNDLKKFTLDNQLDCEIVKEKDTIIATASGISVHAMWPEKGTSAIKTLIALLSSLPENKFSAGDFVKAYSLAMGDDFTGKKLDVNCSDEESGALTYVVGQINYQKETDEYTLISGLRYPSSKDFETIRDKMISNISKLGFETTSMDHLAPVYFKKDNPIIKTLMDAYSEITGDTQAEPLAIGGATYSRALPNSIAFGPVFPWEEELAHEPNEYMNIDSLDKACDVIISALLKLQELDLFTAN